MRKPHLKGFRIVYLRYISCLSVCKDQITFHRSFEQSMYEKHCYDYANGRLTKISGDRHEAYGHVSIDQSIDGNVDGNFCKASEHHCQDLIRRMAQDADLSLF